MRTCLYALGQGSPSRTWSEDGEVSTATTLSRVPSPASTCAHAAPPSPESMDCTHTHGVRACSPCACLPTHQPCSPDHRHAQHKNAHQPTALEPSLSRETTTTTTLARRRRRRRRRRRQHAYCTPAAGKAAGDAARDAVAAKETIKKERTKFNKTNEIRTCQPTHIFECLRTCVCACLYTVCMSM